MHGERAAAETAVVVVVAVAVVVAVYGVRSMHDALRSACTSACASVREYICECMRG